MSPKVMKKLNIATSIFSMMWELQSQSKKAPMVIRRVRVDHKINFAVEPVYLIEKHGTRGKDIWFNKINLI